MYSAFAGIVNRTARASPFDLAVEELVVIAVRFRKVLPRFGRRVVPESPPVRVLSPPRRP